MIARSASDSDPAIDDKDGSLCFGDINRPLRAAHPGDRLRCDDLKSIPTRSPQNIDQQRLAAEFDRIHAALAASILYSISGANFGNDRYPALAMQRLRGADRIFRSASHIGGLRGGDFN
jgi:hypothetical protein